MFHRSACMSEIRSSEIFRVMRFRNSPDLIDHECISSHACMHIHAYDMHACMYSEGSRAKDVVSEGTRSNKQAAGR
jgi:hypothetical protein